MRNKPVSLSIALYPSPSAPLFRIALLLSLHPNQKGHLLSMSLCLYLVSACLPLPPRYLPSQKGHRASLCRVLASWRASDHAAPCFRTRFSDHRGHDSVGSLTSLTLRTALAPPPEESIWSGATKPNQSVHAHVACGWRFVSHGRARIGRPGIPDIPGLVKETAGSSGQKAR